MRDWKYYTAKTWMTTLYVLLGAACASFVAFYVWLFITNTEVRTWGLIILGIVAVWVSIHFLFKLTAWSEKIIEEDENGRSN